MHYEPYFPPSVNEVLIYVFTYVGMLLYACLCVCVYVYNYIWVHVCVCTGVWGPECWVLSSVAFQVDSDRPGFSAWAMLI